MRGVVLLLVVAAGGCLFKPSPPPAPMPAPADGRPQIDANIVFVTSQPVVPSQLGGLGPADALCTMLAMQKGLPGQYVAWLSTAGIDAKDRLGGARGWVRPDGLPFADTADDLLAGIIYYPAMLDESGHAVAGPGDFVVTGTGNDGKAVEDGTGNVLTCTDWTADTGHGAAAGITIGSTGRWTFTTTASCNQAARLYCFEVDRIVPVAPPPITADDRLAFVTSAAFQSGVGPSSADTLCNGEGAALAGHGPFKALLAEPGAAARDRILLRDRPFVRPDGVIAVTDTNLTRFDAPINVGADGKSYVDDVVFAGAGTLDTPGVDAETCSDWTAMTGTAISGYSSVPWPPDLALASTTGCNTAGRVLCFEQRP